MRKRLFYFILLLLACFVLMSCGKETSSDAAPIDDSSDYTVTKDGDSTIITYMDATLRIDGAEYVYDSEWDDNFLCVHTQFTNNGEQPWELGSCFAVQVMQGDDDDIDPRSASDYSTQEEANANSEIEPGASAKCDLYFPVNPDEMATVCVMNPDGMDTDFAILSYFPE